MFRNNVDRESLLKKVQMYGFAVVEATLFLDTHPSCKDALKYYNKYQKLYAEALDDYTKQFGPVTLSDYEPDDKWSWVDDP